MKKLFYVLSALAVLAVSACTQEELDKFLNSVKSIKLDQTQVEMTVGETLDIIASIEPESARTQTVTWTSSAPEVASVEGIQIPDVTGINMPAGKVTALKEGETIITAKVGDKEATCKVIVKKKADGGGGGQGGDGKIEATEITLNKTEITLVSGLSEQLEVVKILPENANEKTVVWESSNPNIAIVTERDITQEDGTVLKGGKVTGKEPGEAIITALAGVARATCKVTVVSGGGGDTIEYLAIDPSPVSLTIDQEQVLTAVMRPSGAKVKVEWTCSSSSVVAFGVINETQAKVQGLAEGKATITASAGGKTATCEVTVEGGTATVAVTSITLDHTQLDMTVGQKAQLIATVLPENATNKTLNWSVMDNRIVSVDGNGELTAQSVGTTTVTVISVMYPSVQASCQVTVTNGGGGGSSTLDRVSIDPPSVTLELNDEKDLTLVLDPSDAEVTIYWESSNSSIAKVQMTSKTTAKVTGMAVGEATLTAHAGELTATCDVTVISSGSAIHVESVTLNVHELQLNVNQQFQLVATVLPENATEKGVVWSSNVQSSKLYIDTNGMVTGLQACEATVTVRCKDNAYIYDTCQITVTGGGSSGGSEEVVDLGLPSGLKWRSMNVGASKPEEYGNYYAWAETSPKSNYASSNYKYPSTNYGDGIIVYAKYDTTPVQGDGKTVLEAEDDAATANLGNGWRMPTFKEFKELRENCTWTWKTQNGVNGMLVTGPNGKSIFLPAGGWYDKTTLSGKTTYGSYWTATGDGGTANAVDFANGYLDKALVPRCEGRSVRPVKD